MTDPELLAAIAEGRVPAFEELYVRHCALAYAVARRILWDAALAEDVVQEAFLGVWRNAARYTDQRGSVKTWLLAIVHHRAIDALRRGRLTVALPEPEASTPEPLTVVDSWPEVAGRLDREEIRGALATVSRVKREAIELAYFGGLTQREIAERTQTPIGTVKSRIRLGLLDLRRLLLATTSEPLPETTLKSSPETLSDLEPVIEEVLPGPLERDAPGLGSFAGPA